MIGARTIAARSVASTPWKNGGGRTRELLVSPAGLAWHARISLADIETDGPFSPFPGVRRWFAVVAGAGVALTFPEGERHLRRGDDPVAFDGADAPMCRLIDGPTRDINLMLRDAEGAMVAAADHHPWSPGGAQCGLFAALPGVCHVQDRALRLEAESLLWFDAPPPVLRFAADHARDGSVGWWLQFSPRRPAR